MVSSSNTSSKARATANFSCSRPFFIPSSMPSSLASANMESSFIKARSRISANWRALSSALICCNRA
ncbi:hypothetical protein THIOM_002785 [Candidatus Thiomargarita nelsonii]|uniref:Uncharacterized protein n=1 Tax=Candidatus Thiomargarita nelsonii TaxID=1003181 RepID=A0A176S0G0_9GAMM|nr:hypothetical protein THIOM_002785 [Candidatus Thiomargarita nelsonii]